MAKLFLGGISPHTQKEDLEIHFGQYGTLTDAVVMIKDGRHRGFGFVTFAEDEAADAVLAEQQVIHDRVIDVKRAVPGNEAPPPRHGGGGGFNGGAHGGGGGAFGGGGGGPMMGAPKGAGKGGGGKGKGGHVGPTDKVFIGGLAPTTNDEVLNEYFGRYGTLVDVVVMKDRMTQKSRGFGFVRYDNTESVESVMADYQSHEIEGKWVEVKKAIPQDQLPPPEQKGFKGGGKGFGGGFEKGGGGYGGGGYGGGGPAFGGGAYGGGGGYGGGGNAMAMYAPHGGGYPQQGYGGCGGYGGCPGGYGGAYMGGPSGPMGMGMGGGGGYKGGGCGGGGFRARPY